MHSVLFVATNDGGIASQKFIEVTRQNEALSKGVAWLADNVWLVNMEENPSALGTLIHLADREKVVYGLLPFEQTPRWLPTGFDSLTVRGRNAGQT